MWGSAPHTPPHFFGRPKKWGKEMRQGSPLGSPISVGDRVAGRRSLYFWGVTEGKLRSCHAHRPVQRSTNCKIDNAPLRMEP